MKKMPLLLFAILFAGDLTMKTASAFDVKWQETLGIESFQNGYRTVGGDPQMISQDFMAPAGTGRCLLLLEVSASRSENMQVFWKDSGDAFVTERSLSFHVPKTDKPILKLVDLDRDGTFFPSRSIRLDPSGAAGLRFTISRAELLTPGEIPAEAWPSVLGFRRYMSKLHFLPGELLQYRATLNCRVYPDRASSKILRVDIYDESGNLAASDVQQFSIKPMNHFKEIYGVLQPKENLEPGQYRLEARAADQRANLVSERASYDPRRALNSRQLTSRTPASSAAVFAA
jgi:hypothetical protein